MESTRRRLLMGIGVYSAGFLLNACMRGQNALPEKTTSGDEGEKSSEEVTATEDLMREHGVLRRALLAYAETVPKLRGNPFSVIPDMLQRTAKLFRAFGEDYHEKKLEETYIFPAVKRAGGQASGLTGILILQHQRGRAITDYILTVTKGSKIDPSDTEPLAKTLESFVLMYQNHAAREDTIVFPAWKQTLTAKQYDEMGDKFEDIEHQQFGEDGFEKALREISEIERGLGFADLAQFTSPPPPAR